MSKYLLYKERMIKNDNTMRDFAESLCEGVPTENLRKDDNFKDDFINLAIDILEYDISRTDIDYENLMYKYRSELGDLLYEVENNGFDISSIKFFGEEAKKSFNNIIIKYIDIHFNELI